MIYGEDYEAKKDVIIYDYVDAHIKVLEGMYHKRLRTYKKMGYEICLNLTSEKQQANSIFDSETYKPVFEKDLIEANREIVISSPGLNVPKVKAFIRQIKAVQENVIFEYISADTSVEISMSETRGRFIK